MLFVFAETNITGQVAFLEGVQNVANDIVEIVTPFPGQTFMYL